MDNRLIQVQCQREGTIFYYQTDLRRVPWKWRCPLCGSKRTEETGRTYSPISEASPLAGAR